MLEFTTFFSQAKPKLPFLPGTLSLPQWVPIPHKFRSSAARRLRRRQHTKSPAADDEPVTALKTSLNPADGVRALLQHRWSLYDVQHIFTAMLLVFSFAIAPMPVLVQLGIVTGYSLLLLVPATRQFFLPSLPIWTYLLYFFSSRFIPVQYRPHIWVKVLPALENVMYGANLSNILSAHTNAVLDILAWLPYGLGHFGAPAVTAGLLFVFASPGTTPSFARAFGYMNFAGVTIQLLFPCTPPWYERAHGLDQPARYGMEGSPAGLARVDQLLGVDMYTTSFTNAPMPFGAFPSLHAADATLEALFLCYCFPRFRPVFLAYVAWIWWATMYLNHHYAVDLVAGSLIAAVAFRTARSTSLPRRQLGKRSRWDYRHVESPAADLAAADADAKYPSRKLLDEESGYDLDENEHSAFGGRGLRRRGTTDSDEWTVGTASSSSSLSEASQSSSGPGSPSSPDADFRTVSLVGLTPQGHMWEGGNVRESDLSEVVVMR